MISKKPFHPPLFSLQENCSGAQIGVYTTDYVGNNTMEGYAYEVFQAWGLGSAAVHEMARDEARHGKALEGMLKRYFNK